jgi:hypothetical protein
MKNFILFLGAVSVFACASLLTAADKTNPSNPSSPIYVIANADGTLHSYGSFFTAGVDTHGNPTLTFDTNVNTMGLGIAGGFFGTQRVAMQPSSSAQCVYVSDAGTNDIAAINISGMSPVLVGTYTGSSSDNGNTNGIGMVVNQNYLYAGYTASNTIATFSVSAGCSLTFLGDISVTPLDGGFIAGMALNGNILVAAYIDGSIQSFNTANGIPISNNDEQYSAGYAQAYFPDGVDITQDGHYAIFGDAAITTAIEVSDISSGKLTPTILYPLGDAVRSIAPVVNSSVVRLSPDESLLYIANSQSGNVTAAFFNKNNGKVAGGCASQPLSGFYNPWAYIGSLATRDTAGTGNVLYAAEFASFIAIINVSSTGTACTLTEAPSSPVSDEASPGLLSIGVFPPRPF